MISTIIPVYNNYDFTAQCLQSLADTSLGEPIEVLVVDNASTDMTKKLCSALGQKLFPQRFKYIRLETNKNFAGANNIGAREATGEYLFLLNNDTILLDGWLPPLLKAINSDDSLGAIGPLLVYPKQNNTFNVQHAGVAISLNRQVTHLYEGINYKNRLFKKERFFQVVTGAALLVKRNLYLNIKGLNEDFINGFEDVEFCYRLTKAGFRQKVVPDSVIIHYGSKSAGRKDHDEENSKLCTRLCPHLSFDEAKFFRDDGYRASISPWGMTLEPSIDPKRELKLLSQVQTGNIQDLEQAVFDEPYWTAGALMLAKRLEGSGKLNEAFEVFASVAKRKAAPDTLIPFYSFLERHKQTEGMITISEILASFAIDEQTRLEALHNLRLQLQSIDQDLLCQVNTMIKNNKNFFQNDYKILEKFI